MASRSPCACGGATFSRFLITTACGGGAAPPPSTPAPSPLTYPAAESCRDYATETAARCTGLYEVSELACGPYRVLVVETDPERVTYAKERLFYDGAGKPFGRSTFANEYSRTMNEGVVPSCAPAPPKSACHRSAAASAPVPKPVTLPADTPETTTTGNTFLGPVGWKLAVRDEAMPPDARGHFGARPRRPWGG